MKESPKRNRALTGCVSLVIDEGEVWKMKRQGRGGREREFLSNLALEVIREEAREGSPGKRTQDANEFPEDPAFDRSIYIYI